MIIKIIKYYENTKYSFKKGKKKKLYKINFFSNIGKILHLYTFSHNSCGLFIFKKSLKPGLWVLIAVGGANIEIVHFFDHGYLEEEKSMMHCFSYFWQKIFWQAWLLVFLPTKLSVSLKQIFFVSLKSTKITSKIQISVNTIKVPERTCDTEWHLNDSVFTWGPLRAVLYSAVIFLNHNIIILGIWLITSAILPTSVLFWN